MKQHATDGQSVCIGTRKRRVVKVVRAFAIVVLALTVVHLALLTAAPLLVSTTAVRSAMERNLSSWTGEQTTIGSTPEFSFWPEPRITLADVTIVKASAAGDLVLGRIERLSASFGVIAALRGEPAFSDFEFVRPAITVTRDQSGHVIWTGGGMLGAALAHTRAETTEDAVFDAEIGTVTIEDGTVMFADTGSGQQVPISGISGRIKWPSLSAKFEGKTTASVGGRAFSVELSTAKPLNLFAGKDTEISLTVRAPGFGGYFDGPANLFDGKFLSGDFRLDIPDMPGFLAWGDWKQTPFINVKRASASAQVQSLGDNMRLDKFEATFDDSSANGLLDFMMPPGKKPKVGGTLAFDTIDVAALIDTFSALPPGYEKTPGLLPQWLDFDVTLSAARASLAPLTLEQMAASITTSGDKRQFNIIDSRLEGGGFTAQLIDGGGASGDQLQLSASDIDLGAVLARLPIKGPLPRGRGSFDLSLDFKQPMAVAGLSHADGKLRLVATAGRLEPFNLDAILQRATSGRFFRLSETGDGKLDYDRIEILANLADGSAMIEKGLLESAGSTLSLSGIIPYADNGLALLARFTSDPAKSQGEPEETRVFVGGSWPDPVISPMSQ